MKIKDKVFNLCILLSKRKILKLADKKYLELLFKLKFNKKLDLNNPQTFNEKLQWLKLNDRKEVYTIMVDKNLCKDYVAKKIGEEYIIPTINVYDSFSDINFEKLPQQFVIKCSHDSGSIVICKDKNQLDIKKSKKKIDNSLKKNYYYDGREWPYKNIVPKVIVEKYMIDENLGELRDYKFFCFNGKVKYFKIDFDRYTRHGANYFDRNGNLMPFGEEVCPPNYAKKLELPINLEKMVKLAERLSKDIPFLRVDFYEINGNIFFGELTFFPSSGFGRFIPSEWDLKLGEEININKGEKI